MYERCLVGGLFYIAVCRLVRAERNPDSTLLGVHEVVLFLFPLNGPYDQNYGPSYLLPSPGRGVHIGV